ncbi:MAG: hypothetical protein AAF572_22355 [Cyanobacteria bacterium P01_B01_bin.77]
MFQYPSDGADRPKSEPAPLPEHQFEIVRHTLFGTLTALQNTIKLLHKLHYTEPNDWSKPLPTGRSNKVMAILTKRVRVD